MQLNREALEELRVIYREEFHQDISLDEAAEIGSRLLDLMNVIIGPRPHPAPRRQAGMPPV